jgi:hypothetical protein
MNHRELFNTKYSEVLLGAPPGIYKNGCMTDVAFRR